MKRVEVAFFNNFFDTKIMTENQLATTHLTKKKEKHEVSQENSSLKSKNDINFLILLILLNKYVKRIFKKQNLKVE